MGLLAPLYALAALALVGPLVFHLIRRQPRGQVAFSSLMFLSPSPPRLTRRSRLDNLWLLALRILALILIAAAFTRPFLRQDQFLNTTLGGRHVILLVDTSGSMQRGDVWAGAQQMGAEVLDGLSPADRVALFTIDRQLIARLPIEDSLSTDPSVAQQAARDVLAELAPTWQPTALAEGLKSLVDLIASQSVSAELPAGSRHEVVLITDLASGIRLEGLQGFTWPENINLDVRQVLPVKAGNARLSLLQATAEDESPTSADASSTDTVSDKTTLSSVSGNLVRVRVENDSDAPIAPLQLSWADVNGPMATNMTSLQVPPGQVRVVPLGERPPAADRIVLTGDSWDGDNTLYVVEPVRETKSILFCGSSQSKPEEDLSYFLKLAPLSSERTQREVHVVTASELPQRLALPETCALVIEPTAAVLSHSAAIESYAERGGVIICCLSRPLVDGKTDAVGASLVSDFLQKLLHLPEIGVTEAEENDFSLLGKVDFSHPVFAPLSDPRFNDFSKLRFWSHRGISISPDSPVRVIASLDDQTPLLLETARGQGRVWLLSAGWQPTASGLGLSSKFIPILMGMIDPQTTQHSSPFSYEVGDKIEVVNAGQVVVSNVHGEPLEPTQIVRAGTTIELLRPGIFWLTEADERRQVAVQVPASESRQVPLDVAQVEQYGIAVGPLASDARRRETLRQMQTEELESKQRLWQWLLVACLVVLVIETWLAGWLSR